MKTDSALSEILKRKLIDGDGYSAVRIGDGEGRLIGWDAKSITYEILWVFRSVMGYEGPVQTSQFKEFQGQFFESLLKNDVIFTHGTVATDRYRDDSVSAVRAAGYKGPIENLKVVSALLENKLLEICEAARRIFIVTSRSAVSEKFWEKKGIRIPPQNVFLIPSEGKFRWMFPEPLDEMEDSIYPTYLLKITNSLLKEIGPGDLVLVGAGMPKVFFLQAVREKGGVGLDIGSYIDILCDIPTRGSANKNQRLMEKNEFFSAIFQSGDYEKIGKTLSDGRLRLYPDQAFLSKMIADYAQNEKVVDVVLGNASPRQVQYLIEHFFKSEWANNAGSRVNSFVKSLGFCENFENLYFLNKAMSICLALNLHDSGVDIFERMIIYYKVALDEGLSGATEAWRMYFICRFKAGLDCKEPDILMNILTKLDESDLLSRLAVIAR